MVEVADEYSLERETLYASVRLVDRCLSLMKVSRSKLQLLGCGCMLLAAKYEEVYHPRVDGTYTIHIYIYIYIYDRY